MFSRFLIAVAAAAVVLGGSVCAKAAEVLNFGIISTESSQNLKQLWDPFLADMEKATGFKVKAFFASDYAGIIEGMRCKKLELCWTGNEGAIQMVDRSDGSVFAQTTAADGTDGYYSLLVVNKESPLKSVDDVLKNAAGLRFSNGDPNSTSGFLVPGYYVFAKNNVDPKKFFKNVVAANHESNALAVANRQVDVATCNNEAIGRLEIAHPEKAAQMEFIQGVIVSVRTIRAELGISPGHKLTLRLHPADEGQLALIEENRPLIMSLAKLEDMQAGAGVHAPKASASDVVQGCQIIVPLKGNVDLNGEVARLEKEMGKIQNGLDMVSKKLANKSFVERAKPEVVERERARAAELSDSLEKLKKLKIRFTEAMQGEDD